MSRTPKFTVVVPTYGRPTLLGESLASIAAQSERDFECLIVDDASPEYETPRVPDGRFRVIQRSENGGPAAARNTGIVEARGRWLAFLDDDDLWTKDRLAIAEESLRLAPVGLCAAGKVGEAEVRPHDYFGVIYDQVLDRTTPPIGATAILRSTCPLFDESFAACEDLEWWLQVSKNYPVHSDRRLGWLWRSHSGERAAHGSPARLRGSLHLLDRHAEYFRSHPKARHHRWMQVSRYAAREGERSLAASAAWRAVLASRAPSEVIRAGRLLSLAAIK